MDFFVNLFNSSTFMPHGHCYLWRPEVLWLNVVSDALIAIAYFAIPLFLVAFVRKNKNVPFSHIFWLFGAFIVLCGTTHVIDVWTVWDPQYRLEGVVKALTALISLATAVTLIPILPRAIQLPSLKKALDELAEKHDDLEKTNHDLERFHSATLGREDRILELKAEVNRLSQELGRNEIYKLGE